MRSQYCPVWKAKRKCEQLACDKVYLKHSITTIITIITIIIIIIIVLLQSGLLKQEPENR